MSWKALKVQHDTEASRQSQLASLSLQPTCEVSCSVTSESQASLAPPGHQPVACWPGPSSAAAETLAASDSVSPPVSLSSMPSSCIICSAICSAPARRCSSGSDCS